MASMLLPDSAEPLTLTLSDSQNTWTAVVPANLRPYLTKMYVDIGVPQGKDPAGFAASFALVYALQLAESAAVQELVQSQKDELISARVDVGAESQALRALLTTISGGA